MLAILGDFQNEEPAEVVRQLLDRLLKASTDKAKLQRYIRQLTVLAQLRSLREETQKQIRTMPITFDITKDSLYIQGRKKGEEKGEERGEERTKEKLIINLLKTTNLSVTAIAKAAEVSQKYVKELKAKHLQP